jgi:hypothetical protein
MTPLAGAQESAVQALLSSSARGVPGLQTPAASQVSVPLQRFPSLHEEPAAIGL